MDSGDRRKLLWGLGAWMAVPLLLGRKGMTKAITIPDLSQPPARRPAPSVAPPAHSVKRRG